MIRKEDNNVIVFCEKCHKETKINLGTEENRAYFYCGYCGELIKDELIIRKNFEEYLKTARLVDIGEENYRFY